MSFPREKQTSVNSLVENEIFEGSPIEVKLPKVDDLVQIIKQKGRGCLLFKRDLKRAYRQIFIDPGDVHLFGFQWEGRTYLDCALPMGLSISAYICQRVTNAISFIAHTHGVDCVTYLDDVAGAEIPSQADAACQTLGSVFHECGVVEAHEKIHFPATRMPFVGILFDTEKLTLEITPERLSEIKRLLSSWLSKQQATRNELESLLGKLNFIAFCMRPGRIFLARLYNALSGWPARAIPIPPEIVRDIWWWFKFVSSYNGISMMPWQEFGEPDAELTTDACLLGGGATFQGEHISFRFPEHITRDNPNINFLEFITVIVAARVWKEKLRNKRLVIHCDNLVTVHVINTGRSKSRNLQRASCELVYHSATGCFQSGARLTGRRRSQFHRQLLFLMRNGRSPY